MTWLIGAVLGIMALAVVSLPFFKRRSPVQSLLDALRELQARRQDVYRETQLLHNDWTVGQVSEEEYQQRLQALRLQAASLLKEETQLREMEERLEEEVLALRVERPAGGQAAAALVCPNCSRMLPGGASECPVCGAKVTEGASHG